MPPINPIAPVTLHPVRFEDGPDLIAAHSASRVLHTPWVEPFTDRAGFETWFAQTQSPANASFLVRDGAQKLVGVINLSQIVHGNFCSAYCGFYAMQGATGRGLMTTALRLAIIHAFTAVNLHRLEANIQPANKSSIALVQRAGFQKEGFSPSYLRIAGAWRDHERWAVLNDEMK
jgi:ribosomal-protein-alanine N-acetyltransferase